jgi:nitrogen fixation protein FixH
MTAIPAERRPFEVTGRLVLICIVAFFVTVATVNAIMIRFALTTFGGVETESSYKAGLAFKAEAAASVAQDRLGWSVDMRIDSSAGKTKVHVDVRDAAAVPVRGLEIVVNAAHPADRRRDVMLTVFETSSGSFAASVPAGLGRRILAIELHRDGERVFRSLNRVALP